MLYVYYVFLPSCIYIIIVKEEQANILFVCCLPANIPLLSITYNKE